MLGACINDVQCQDRQGEGEGFTSMATKSRQDHVLTSLTYDSAPAVLYTQLLNVSQLNKRSKTWLCKKFHNSIYYNTTTLPAMSLCSLYANLLFSLLAPLYSMFWPQQYVLHITVYTAVLSNSLPSLLNIKTDSSGLISTTLHSR